jgi:hypothetical protein
MYVRRRGNDVDNGANNFFPNDFDMAVTGLVVVNTSKGEVSNDQSDVNLNSGISTTMYLHFKKKKIIIIIIFTGVSGRLRSY